MHKILRLFGFLVLLVLSLACSLVTSFQPTTTPTLTASPSPGLTISPSPSLTATLPPSPTVTETPLPTPTASITPSPTATSVLVAGPIEVDTSGQRHAHRPKLTGNIRYVDTRHFRIFYTLAGEDGVPIEDTNGNAIPDTVEAVAEDLEHAWQIEVETLGWAPPPADEYRGGDNRYDIYLQDLDFSIAGYARGGGILDFVGDNPKTERTEINAATSYVAIDNDFAEIEGVHTLLSRREYIQTTTAHELVHALQNGYDSLEPHLWLWEATATWMETIVYPDITGAYFFLDAAFKSPDTCLLDYGGHTRLEDRGHWYAMWLLLRMLSDQYGEEIVRQIWEHAIELDGYEAIESTLAGYDTDLGQVYRQFAVALLMRDFDFKLDYPSVRLEGEVTALAPFTPQDGVGQFGADFIGLDGLEGVVEINLRGLQQGIVVGVNPQQAEVYYFDHGTITVDTGLYQHVYLIVLNLDQAETISDCRLKHYYVQFSSGEQAATPPLSVNARRFAVPHYEPLLDPDDWENSK